MKQQTFLELEKNRLDQLNISLQKRQTELKKLCQEHETTRKIEITVAGILRKNFRFVRQLEEVESRAKEQLDALEIRVARDKINTRYRVTVSDTLSNEKATSLIVDAILFAPQAVQLVARSSDNNLKMEKDWEHMSELDKDELIDKKIVREL